MLRVASQDYNKELTKGDLLMRCKRATTIQWVNFLIASKSIKIWRDQQPTSLYNCLIENCYTEQRKPGPESSELAIDDERYHNTMAH